MLLPAFLLGACLQQKSGKSADSWVPSWDSAQYAPRKLSKFHDEEPEGLFAVFGRMESVDSAVSVAPDRVFPKNPVDTLRIDDMFDTGFVFPPVPEAAIPYAYDDTYRDDTLFRKSYGNGLFEQEHPCVESFVMSGEFLHPAQWLQGGMKREDILASLGTPFVKHPAQLRYRWHSEPERGGADSVRHYESMRFYFERDSLFAVLLQRSKPCF